MTIKTEIKPVNENEKKCADGTAAKILA